MRKETNRLSGIEDEKSIVTEKSGIKGQWVTKNVTEKSGCEGYKVKGLVTEKSGWGGEVRHITEKSGKVRNASKEGDGSRMDELVNEKRGAEEDVNEERIDTEKSG